MRLPKNRAYRAVNSSLKNESLFKAYISTFPYIFSFESYIGGKSLDQGCKNKIHHLFLLRNTSRKYDGVINLQRPGQFKSQTNLIKTDTNIALLL